MAVPSLESEQHRRLTAGIGQDGDPLGAELTGPGTPLVGVVDGLEEREISPHRGVDVDAEHGGGRGRPGLVTVTEHPDRAGGVDQAVDQRHRPDADRGVPPVGHPPGGTGRGDGQVDLQRSDGQCHRAAVDRSGPGPTPVAVVEFGLEPKGEEPHAPTVGRRGQAEGAAGCPSRVADFGAGIRAGAIVDVGTRSPPKSATVTILRDRSG